MPRRKFPYTRSDETYEVLRAHVGPIAKEYPCDSSYVYSIRNGDSNDPYPHFRHLFLAAARAEAPVEIWLRDLSSILTRALPGFEADGDLLRQLTKKISAEADSTSKILEAIGDRVLDRKECHEILAVLEIDADIKNGIRRIVERRLAEIVSPAIKAV